MPKKDYHVVPRDGKWAVVGEGVDGVLFPPESGEE
jgi:hypothetical protein